MNKADWLVSNEIHNGAHYPLCVFTDNTGYRSEAKAKMRATRKYTSKQGADEANDEAPRSWKEAAWSWDEAAWSWAGADQSTSASWSGAGAGWRDHM